MPARGLSRDMELRVIEKEDTAISIEVAGEDHTFMNVLKGALLETEGVTAATYDMNPEQSGGQTDPVLTIKTDADTDALDALEAGADRVIEKSDDFEAAFDAAA
jgi:DNA-directed RNA polymerase subunit L